MSMTNIGIGILSYNEAKSLPAVVHGVIESLRLVPAITIDIVIINNGSKDETPSVIAEIEKKFPCVRHLDIAQNQGYGYGVQQGLQAVQGDIVGYMWGDNQFDPGIIGDMVHLFMARPDVRMVKTYRVKRYDGPFRLVVSTIYQCIFRLLYGFYTKDINSCPKLFRRELLEEMMPLCSTDWFIDAEIMIKASNQMTPAQLAELPIIFHPRKFGRSNVRWKDCFIFFWKLVRYRF